MPKAYQVAAIPIRRQPRRGVEVLLVTSRETRRWVVPKGWPWRKVADHEAAAGEVWEEAGVRGRIAPDCIGHFSYDKLRRGKSKRLKVAVYLLEVTEEAATWPESAQRERAWFSVTDAADRVAEPELKALLLSLAV
jgi:8-oxo-dGTP pyrophosphatase MutT (NUDIX family)